MKRVMLGVWRDLPIWLCVCSLLGDAMMAMAWFRPARPLYVLTALFPLAVVLLYRYAVSPVHAARSTILTFLVLAFLLLAIVLLVEPRVSSSPVLAESAVTVSVPDNSVFIADNGRSYRREGAVFVDLAYKDRFIRLYEWSVAVMVLLLALHCLWYRGWNGFVTFFLVSLLYGFLLESGGVFLGFFRENDYHLYLSGLAAPVATMAGWAGVFYTAIFTFDGIAGRWPRLRTVPAGIAGAVVSMLALFRDINIDPVTTNLAFWTWHADLGSRFLGVPLLNYTSWFCAVFVYGTGYFSIFRHSDWSSKRRNLTLLACIPLFLLLSAVLNFGFCALLHGMHGAEMTILETGLTELIEKGMLLR